MAQGAGLLPPIREAEQVPNSQAQGWPGPAVSMVRIWRMNKQMIDLCLPVCFSFKQKK